MDRTTRFAQAPAWLARLVLLVFVALVVYGYFSGYQLLTEIKAASGSTRRGDIYMYQAVIERLRHGENYYAAANAELRNGGYALRPFFNWRLPTTAWLLSRFPDDVFGQRLFQLLTLVTFSLWIWAFWRDTRSKLKMVVGSLLLLGALILAIVSNIIYFHESWSALAITASLALYRPERWLRSVLLGVLALLFRELALVYVVVMFGAALLEGRRHEAIGWGIGLAVFAVLLVIHATIVAGFVTDADRAKSWLAGNGWSFVLSTAQWNGFIALLPGWIVPLLVPLALIGAAAWRGALGLRIALVLAAYCGAFMLVGNADNLYWGIMYAPLLSLGLLHAVPGLRDLVRAATRTHTLPQPASQQL